MRCDRKVSLVGLSLFLGAMIFGQVAATAAEPLDLTTATIIVPASLKTPEKKAIALLVDEVAKRTGIKWRADSNWPKDSNQATILLGQAEPLSTTFPSLQPVFKDLPKPVGAEGYRIRTDLNSKSVLIVGDDVRGVVFGVGRLLRELAMTRGKVTITSDFQIATAPKTKLRGHQLGYRPKTNSYDGWDLDQWEQYIKDLVVFGTNAIELVPPRTDDHADSPHFPRPQIEMMVGMSRIADEYGIDVWVWYPALDKDYSNMATVEAAINEWAEVFKKMPRIDAIFVPGGDPGHTQPKYMMALLEKQTESLHKYHPHAQMWMSPQGFVKTWYDEFVSIMKAEPKWLTGLVFGPQVRVGLEELRATMPKRYPIRNYPDITHSLNCQYPVPDWDLAFARTYDREPINPRPLGEADIMKSARADSIGFLTYSEGCNDDVNKFVWSGLGWDDQTPVIDILRQFSRYFIGEAYQESFAQGLLGLERNWRGPLKTNVGVETTLRQFQTMEHEASPGLLRNWRFQQALYRAYYDAYVRDRLIREAALESEAYAILRRAKTIGANVAMNQAEGRLRHALTDAVSPDRRTRIDQLAEALFQSIQMQLSVVRYRAIEVGRGTTQDSIDECLNDRRWLEVQFESIRKLKDEPTKLAAIEAILERTNPGPGGFYDNLGDVTQQSHIVKGADFATSPDYRKSWVVGFDDGPKPYPMAWLRNVQSLYDQPLMMKYEGLDRRAQYRIRITYSGDNFRPPLRLEAEGIEIHPLMQKPNPIQSLEFAVPKQETSDGVLNLKWNMEAGRGGNGRGCQISEVWLIKVP